jgi:DNA-binding CsgD family transcriptional regulator
VTQSAAGAIVTAAYATRTVIAYERDALSALRRAIAGDVLFLCRGGAIGPGALGVDPRIARRTRGCWQSYGDELTPVFDDATASGGVSVDAEVLKGAFVTTRVYREFIRPHGGRCTMLGIVSLGDELLATIAVGRLHGSFSDGDRRALASLLPTFAVAEAAVRRKGESWVPLTPREREIVTYLRLGYANRQIAVALGTSVNTVRNQVQGVLRKLGAANRAEAVALSLGHNLT